MWKKLAPAAIVVALFFGPATMPAMAGTETGSATCNSANPVAVFGKQQSLTTMTLKVRGVTFYSKATQYTGYGYSPYASGSWSAESVWLDKAGTFAFCATS
ncbi:hypothetical protein NF556_09620 [Ornithinimicrobium faecis]|uniref:Uncharacterized protein n=1 Tax=Ornithinimicrobium faecis TaxID=2934158 RepID=A0ABY4YYN7_9MICO|nr:hypothetical protein [Ornithinimicrobium sp. HY1793]USQ81877.1 hypothetical protein NF556_09620 [Ornithinimicrobium sp. HY1793]